MIIPILLGEVFIHFTVPVPWPQKIKQMINTYLLPAALEFCDPIIQLLSVNSADRFKTRNQLRIGVYRDVRIVCNDEYLTTFFCSSEYGNKLRVHTFVI